MQRIQKFLSSVGIGSRRKIEEWITAGRIKVNDQVATLGIKVTGSEQFKLDQELLNLPSSDLTAKGKILLYYKPVGKICTRSDPQGRASVFDDLPVINSGRWVAVGRLDFNTSGILLFTDNGELAHKLMHPSFNQEREYLVRAYGKYDPKILHKFTKGVILTDGLAKFKSIELMGKNKLNNWYKVVLTEGKNREIKRLFFTEQLIVNKLIRIRFGDFLLPKDLKPGQYRSIS